MKLLKITQLNGSFNYINLDAVEIQNIYFNEEEKATFISRLLPSGEAGAYLCKESPEEVVQMIEQLEGKANQEINKQNLSQHIFNQLYGIGENNETT